MSAQNIPAQVMCLLSLLVLVGVVLKLLSLLAFERHKRYCIGLTTPADGTQRAGSQDSSGLDYREIAEPLSVSFSQLSFSYGEKTIFRNVAGELRANEITAIMGPSGAGKTSLLSLLRGDALKAETYGVCAVNGRAVTSLAALDRKVAFVPQDNILYGDLTVEENIYYSALLFNTRGYKSLAEVLPMVYSSEKVIYR